MSTIGKTSSSSLGKLPRKITPAFGLKMLERAIKESFGKPYSSSILKELREYFGDNGSITCIYCGDSNPTRWDHYHPVSKGGDTVAGNLVPSCQRCDDSKQQRTLDQWIDSNARHRPMKNVESIKSKVVAYQKRYDYEPSVTFEDKLKTLTTGQKNTYAQFCRELEIMKKALQKLGVM